MGEDFEYTTNDLNSDQKVLLEKMEDSQENIDLYKKLIAKLTDDQCLFCYIKPIYSIF